jgi:hypothetical protein
VKERSSRLERSAASAVEGTAVATPVPLSILRSGAILLGSLNHQGHQGCESELSFVYLSVLGG